MSMSLKKKNKEIDYLKINKIYKVLMVLADFTSQIFIKLSLEPLTTKLF